MNAKISIPFVLATASILLAISQPGCSKNRSTTESRPASSIERELSEQRAGLSNRSDVPQAVDGREHGYRLPGMQCLVNQFGIRRKVIVTDRGVRCVSATRDGVPVGPQLRFFMPYFVFDTHPRNSDGDTGFYQIGPTPQRESLIGWVAASQVASWDTRVGARYQSNAGTRTPPLLVFSDTDALEELVKNNTTQRKPMARAANTGSRSWMPWPIAETRYFNWKGRTCEFVRLNFLGEYKQGGALDDTVNPSDRGQQQYTQAEVEKIKTGVKMLDLCFVVDNTQSTAPFIEAIRSTVEMIAQRLHDLPFKPDVACSLVLYRDYVDSIMFTDDGPPSVFKQFALTTDLAAFLGIIRPLQEAEHSSVDYPEAVYDGVAAGLARTAWRGDGLSARVIVLIGDNSAHEPGCPKNPHGIGRQNIIDFAGDRKRNVKIFSLCIEGAGGEVEQQLHWEQFRDLAKGTGGECYRLDEADKVVAQVRSILETETAVVHTRSVVLDALSEGKTKDQIAAEKQIDVREVTEVMEFLQGGGVDIDRLRPGVPTFATGWCLVDIDGATLLEKEVYAARAEVDMLLSELNAVCVQLSPDLARQAFQMGIDSRVNPMSFFADRRPEPMDVFLMAKGIPCSQGVLKLTRSDIEHMPEERRALLRERIARQIVPQLTNARNNDEYFTWLDDLEFGWIKESLFP